MVYLTEYEEFAGYDLMWVEECVPHEFKLDVLQKNKATEEEIASAVPCKNVESVEVCLQSHVSELLHCFAHLFCTQVKSRCIYFYLKHFLTKCKKIMTYIRV